MRHNVFMSQKQNKNLPNILIVEDDDSQSFMIKEIMKNTWLEKNVYTVKNGNEALSYLKQSKEDNSKVPLPDLIFMDLRMQGGDGIDAIRSLKNEQHLSSIPIIVFTSSEKEEDIVLSYKLGANCYIKKPEDPQKMENVIKILNDFWFGIASLPAKS